MNWVTTNVLQVKNIEGPNQPRKGNEGGCNRHRFGGRGPKVKRGWQPDGSRSYN